MKVALPAVGVLDMLRYHKFTAGAGWAYDYGTADDNPDMFNYLLRYSPVHNVRERTAYPATFITTADHDDRVVPAHSFKFAARLQSAQAGPDPILIRIETNAGHGAGTPVSKSIEQYADIFSFTLWNMELKNSINMDLKVLRCGIAGSGYAAKFHFEALKKDLRCQCGDRRSLFSKPRTP